MFSLRVHTPWTAVQELLECVYPQDSLVAARGPTETKNKVGWLNLCPSTRLLVFEHSTPRPGQIRSPAWYPRLLRSHPLYAVTSPPEHRRPN